MSKSLAKPEIPPPGFDARSIDWLTHSDANAVDTDAVMGVIAQRTQHSQVLAEILKSQDPFNFEVIFCLFYLREQAQRACPDAMHAGDYSEATRALWESPENLFSILRALLQSNSDDQEPVDEYGSVQEVIGGDLLYFLHLVDFMGGPAKNNPEGSTRLLQKTSGNAQTAKRYMQYFCDTEQAAYFAPFAKNIVSSSENERNIDLLVRHCASNAYVVVEILKRNIWDAEKAMWYASKNQSEVKKLLAEEHKKRQVGLLDNLDQQRQSVQGLPAPQ